MHGHDGAAHGGGQGGPVVADEGEVGDGHGVVVLQGVGVEGDEMGVAGVEGEVFGPEHGAEDEDAVTQMVVVADEANVGGLEALQFVAHEFKLLRRTEVGEVAAVDDEIDAAGVDAADGVVGLVVPALGVAQHGEGHAVAAGHGGLYALNVLFVDLPYPMIVGIVGMDVDEVAAL